MKPAYVIGPEGVSFAGCLTCGQLVGLEVFPCPAGDEHGRRTIQVDYVRCDRAVSGHSVRAIVDAQSAMHEATQSALAAENADLHQRLERAIADVDALRDALRSVHGFLTGGSAYHNQIGVACGIDACIVCLAEGTAKAALDEAHNAS
jgi:hypothetical protein